MIRFWAAWLAAACLPLAAVAAEPAFLDNTEPSGQESARLEKPIGQYYLGLGPAFLPDVLNTSGNPQLNLHAAFNWDFYYAVVNVFGDFTFNGTRAGLAAGGVAMDYPLLSGRSTIPFVGAEVGYGAAFPTAGGSNDVVGGFLINGVAGLQFFRGSSTTMDLSLRMGFFSSQVQGVTPFVAGLRLGIYFGGGAGAV